jgi:signal transduction histidine kinase
VTGDAPQRPATPAPAAPPDAGPPWLLTDLAGVIRDANAAAAALLNAPPSFVMGKPLLVYFSPDQYAPLLRHLKAARDGEHQWTTRLIPWRRPPVEVRLTVGPAWNHQLRTRGLAWTLEPVPVAAAAAPTTAEIKPPANVETLQRAFVSAMSHELLTPLAIIQGHAETLRYPAVRTDQGQVDHALDAIRDETARLRRLVQNVIDSARASAGELEVRPAPSDLAPLLTRIARRFEARSRRHRFVPQLPGHLPPVLADLERLESVIYNLLDNALKYSPRGGTICIRAETRSGEMEVSVEDEGIGIAPGDLAHVFAPYYRGEEHNGSRAQGSGLGLYLSKAVIDAHGGRIWIEPRSGGGSTVRFTLLLA